MIGVLARLVLFVSSYAPLLALFAILDSFGPGWPSVVCASVAVLSVAGLVAVWVVPRSGAGDWLRLRESSGRDHEVMGYFVSYVIPFAAADAASTRTRVALAVFAVVIAALYLRAAIFYIHPLLLLVGVHVYGATTDDGAPVIVLTRRRFLRQHEQLWAVPFGQSVYREVAHP